MSKVLKGLLERAELDFKRQQTEVLKAQARVINAQAETQEMENRKTRKNMAR